VAAAAHIGSDEDYREAMKNSADAKARIAIYGAPSVIHALACFEETGSVLNNAVSVDAFLNIVSAMRGTGSSVSTRDLRLLLTGQEAPSVLPKG
jgi:hypothetical protein